MNSLEKDSGAWIRGQGRQEHCFIGLCACGNLFVLFTSKIEMAEEQLILLDRKILSLDLSALCEFALHAKVEKSAVEGKGKLSVIRSIRRKIEDSVEELSGHDQVKFIEGLIAYLGPPPLERMEDQYGQEELESKGDL